MLRERCVCARAHALVCVHGQAGVVWSGDGGAFRVLNNEEVEEHLTAISERD